MNSRLTTRTRGLSRGKQKCRSSRPRDPYLSTPVMKETTAWGTCSEQLEPRTKKRPKLLQRKETNNAAEAGCYVTCNWFTAGRAAGAGTSRIFGGIRHQQTADAERNTGEVGDDQSSFMVPRRRSRTGWKSDGMDDRGRQPERTHPPGRHEKYREDRNRIDHRGLSGKGRYQQSRRQKFHIA